jgi:hypothetical protein
MTGPEHTGERRGRSQTQSERGAASPRPSFARPGPAGAFIGGTNELGKRIGSANERRRECEERTWQQWMHCIATA